MWSRRGLVLQIGSTAPATPPHGVPALLKRFEPAICGTVFIIALGAPRIVSRLSRFFDADDGGENYKDEQRKPHGYLLGKTNNLKHSCAMRNLIRIKSEAWQIAVNIAKLPELLRNG